MRYGSICSGVEAASLACAPLGWTPAFLAEVEPFPCALLQQRWDATPPLRPLAVSEAVGDKDRLLRKKWAKEIALLPKTGSVRNLGDFTKIQPEDYDGHIDLLVGGTPCQSFSIAGLRGGLSDPRGNLMLEFTRLAYRTSARWVVWENVPGVLTSGDKGSDFAAFLSLLVGWEVKPPKDDGASAESSPTPPDASAWRGECLTLNTPEFPNFQGRSRSDGVVSSLSDILIRGPVPQRFYLTVKCAVGILRRAANRGKRLPEILRRALLRIVRSASAAESPATAMEPSSAKA